MLQEDRDRLEFRKTNMQATETDEECKDKIAYAEKVVRGVECE